MAKKISNNSIRNIEENWALDDRNGNPYSGASVQEFLKNALLGKAGDFFFDADSNKYLIFADQQRREQYLQDRENNQDLVLGTFDAPANYTTEIYLTTPTSNVILSGTEGNYVDFTFDIKNKNGSSTGESVIATYTFNNSGNIKKATQVYNAGTSVHFLVDQYLEDGTNSITIVITGRNTLVSTMASVTYNVVNLQLTSSFDFSKPYDADQDMPVPYELVGTGVKYVDWYIDGVDIDDLDTIALARVTPTKNIDISNLSEGKHNLQIRAYFSNNGNSYYSKTLYFDFVVAPSGGTFTSNQTHVLLGLILNELVTTTLSVNVTQYQEFSYKASVFDSRNRALSLIITDNGTLVLSISAHSETILDLTYMPVTTGNHTIGFSADTASASITAAVQDSGLGINEVTEGLTLKLSAKGRNNNETNPATWTYGNVTTTFNNFEWNNTCGWNNGALVIPAGSSIDVNFAPLSGTPVLNGRTFEIDFETTNISDETANILNIVDSNTGAGINIKPNTAKLQSAGGASINTRFRDGDRLHLTFIINRTSGDDARFIYIVNNGIVERAARFAATDNFNVSTLMHIGSTGCTIKLHSIKVYDKAITIDEAFQNYAIESNNVVEIVNKNDILNDITGLIDVDKVNAKVPVMIITGNINSILSINDKAHKNDWNTYPVDIEYRNMLNPELNFFIDDADIRLQGTSSISYPRKNFRIYSKSKSDKYATKLYSPTHNPEDLIANGKYSFKAGSAPVSCWCLKADYAESSGSHNVGIAKLWNTVMKNTSDNGNYILRTAAQNWATANEYEYDVRTTIDGFPIVLFLRDNINAPLVCLGQYNFNNDKSTEEVFGFTELSKDGVTSFDNSAVECWEVLDSDNSIALFTNVSNFDNAWEDAFEARYPKSPTTTALKRVCLFINSCYDSSNDTVDVEAWQQDKADYFDLNKLAAYYVYLLRFGAVDQTVKNAMFTTEDGQHWFYINYDNDTVLGIDNESRQFDVWDYGLFTQTPQGGYYYAGKGKSVLWRLFEADSECMALARHMDALLFNAGLTYEAVCNMFDVEQCGKWCERIYNENGRYKYITQAMEGKNVLHMLQGSRESHRHWWLQHRFEKYDNVFGNGTYSIRSIKARATGSALIPEGAAYKYTPAITTYFGYSVGDNTIDPPTERTANVEYTATGLTQASGVGNFIYIYNANNLAAIDLSAYISALGSLDVSDAKDVYGNSRLTKIVLGDGVNTNAYLTAIGGLSYIAGLEELDIRGYQAITSIDLDDLYNLHTFKAQDSGLTSFKPSAGSTLTSVSLPSGIASLEFNSNTVNSFTYTPTKTLQSLSLTNVSGSWDAKSFTNTWLALFTDSELENVSLTLTGINWTNMTAQQVLNLAKPGTHILRGRVTLSSITYQEYRQIVQVYGQNVFDSSSSFVIDAPAGIYFSGPELVVEGSSVTLSAVAFPVGESIVYHLYDDGGTEINPVEGIATYGGVTLNVNTGALSVGTINTDTYVKLRAVAGQAVSELQRCKIVNITTIGGFTVDGETEFTSTGANTLTIVPTLSQYNVAVTSIAVQAQSMSELLSFAYDTLNLTISVTVSAIPSADVTQACTVVVTDALGNEFTSQLTLKIKVVRINNFTVSGTSKIVSKGTYSYTISDLLPENHNKDITSIDVETSPSTGLMITGKTTSGFNLFVTNMPDYTTNVTLTVVATLDNNTSVTKTKTVQLKVVSNLDVLDELGVAIMHVDGSFYTKEQWQAEGFTTAYANGIAISDAQTNPTNPTRIIVSGHKPDSAYTDVYTFPDSTVGRIPSVTELFAIGNVATDVNTLLNLIGWQQYSIVTKQETPRRGYISSDLNPGTPYYKTVQFLTTGGSREASDTAWGYSTTFVCTPRAVPLNKPVDLGLPSGRLWSNVNLGAASAEEAGLYYQWGNVEGHDGEDGYDFSSTHYAETPGGQISEMTLPVANDAANDALGGSWRIPTQADFNELLDTNYTTWLWTTINGVDGYRITSKSNGNSIFIPITGYIDDSGVKHNYTTNGSYWTASLYNLNSAFKFNISSSNKQINYSTSRYYALAIRPVLDPPELIGDASVGAGTHNYTITRLSNISYIGASVSTPTAGSVSVSTSGTTTVILNVTDTPNDDESITLVVVATLTDGSTKTITKSVLLLGEEYVDLGLPSGLLWCKHNLGAQSATDAGLYFAWGETTGYADAAARNTALDRSDGFSEEAYTATGGAAITDSVLTWAHDAAAQIMGGDWRMPTSEELNELIQNTTNEKVSENGVKYIKFTSKVNTDKFILVPLAGRIQQNDLVSFGNYLQLMGSSWKGITYVPSTKKVIIDNVSKYFGNSIRPVCMPTKTVDLGLPSGTLWADRNVGASSEEDYGAYFSWGNITPHYSTNGSTFDDSYDWGTSNSGPYASTPGASVSANIASNDSAHDAALALLGSPWHLPTKENFQELYNNTDNEWTSINGVYGRKFMKKSDHSVYIFLPAAGLGFDASLYSRGTNGYYWSSSFSSAGNGYRLDFSSSSIYPNAIGTQCGGDSVRAVQ